MDFEAAMKKAHTDAFEQSKSFPLWLPPWHESIPDDAMLTIVVAQEPFTPVLHLYMWHLRQMIQKYNAPKS